MCLIQIELDHHCRITHVCFVQTIDFEYLVANLDCVGIVIFKWRYYAGFVMISCGIRVWERNTVIVISIQTTATYIGLVHVKSHPPRNIFVFCAGGKEHLLFYKD